MACHIAYEVEEEAAAGFFESICKDSPFEYDFSDTSGVFLSSDSGHWADNTSSASGTDDEDDEEVVFPLDWYVYLNINV